MEASTGLEIWYKKFKNLSVDAGDLFANFDEFRATVALASGFVCHHPGCRPPCDNVIITAEGIVIMYATDFDTSQDTLGIELAPCR